LAALAFGLLIAGCDPCAAIDAAPSIAPAAAGAAQVRVSITTESLSGLAAAQRPLGRGTRRVRRIEDTGGPRTLVATAASRGSLLMDDPDASEDCPECGLLRVRIDLALAAGPSPLVVEPDENLGGARATVLVPVRLELRSEPSMPGTWRLVASHDPLRPTVVPPLQLPTGRGEAVDEGLAALVEEVARFDAVKESGTNLLRLRGWQVHDPDLALADLRVEVDGRLVRVAGAPKAPLGGAGLDGLEVEPGLNQDVTWAIAPAYLAALADDLGPTLPAVSLEGVPHDLHVIAIESAQRGVSARLRARRTEGCGWLDVESDGLRGTSDGRGSLKVLVGTDAVVGSGGRSGPDADAGFLAAAGRRAQELVQERLAHPLIQGPTGQAPRVLLVRHDSTAAILADLAFPQRPGRARRPRPMPEDFSKLPTVKLQEPR